MSHTVFLCRAFEQKVRLCYCCVEAWGKRGYKDKDGKIQGANPSTCPIVEGSMGRQNTITAASRVPSNFLSLSFSNLPSSGFYPASRFLSRSHRKPFFGTKNASNSRPLLLLLAACSTWSFYRKKATTTTKTSKSWKIWCRIHQSHF